MYNAGVLNATNLVPVARVFCAGENRATNETKDDGNEEQTKSKRNKEIPSVELLRDDVATKHAIALLILFAFWCSACTSP